MKRRLLIAANWKMNLAPAGFADKGSPYKENAAVDVVVFPTFLDVPACVKAGLATGGQWGHPKPNGACTGDVSMAMLKTAGCRYVLCGHSERRKHHCESDAFVAEQTVAALEIGLHPIVCVGETGDERKAGKVEAVLKKQLAGLPHGKITIAYEPVWAIGTGLTPSMDDIAKAHAFIRSQLPEDARASTRILYGGSASAMNAADILKCDDVDGLLVGGASLKTTEFGEIVEAALMKAKSAK